MLIYLCNALYFVSTILGINVINLYSDKLVEINFFMTEAVII